MLITFFIYTLWIPIETTATISTVSDEHAICFGALSIDLPVRYLHIQLRDNGVNVTASRGKLDISLKTECKLKKHQKQFIDQLHLDGNKLTTLTKHCHETLDYFVSENKSLLYSEFCDCPELSSKKWMRLARCNEYSYEQLDNDLKQWQIIDFKQLLNTAIQKWASPDKRYSIALCHYQIINNQESAITNHSLKSNGHEVPFKQFIFNLGDWPLEQKQSNAIAVASWCGSNETSDIVLPTYELMKSVIDSMYTTTLDIHTAKGETHWPWHQKKQTAVFRGRDSSKLRLEIAMLSQKRPDLIDAGITRYFFFNESHYTPHVKQKPFSEFFQHRYVLSIDGTVAAYRLPFLLAGDSVVFKADSQFYEHFYSVMQPYVHYIPFQLSNIIVKIESAKNQQFDQVLLIIAAALHASVCAGSPATSTPLLLLCTFYRGEFNSSL
ncbi:unnamed protein product [Anisakis simplex]|uniref:CAP10 domain-containing protein n=1 Tax=Anisakis simplex TaxID=6269 RepID=A0A0M3JQX8_ANISI|nr:unnamed protein product [Anisakis simplex]